MFLKSTRTCDNCKREIPKDANFCPYCKAPQPGGVRKCGKCGTENPSDAKFCLNCKEPLAYSEAPSIYENRWARGSEDFAVRIDTHDLPGILNKGINVEMGTNAVLLENGASRGVLPPGPYTMSTFWDKFKGVFSTGVPKSMTILLVGVTPVDLDFHLGGIFTKDPLKIGMTIRLQAEVHDPGRFLANMLAGKERFSVEMLRQYLYPEIVSVAETWVRSHTAQELADDLSLKDRLELALEEALKRTFNITGLRFLQIRAMAVNLEVLDKIKGIKSDYALQVSEAEAVASGRKTMVDAHRELNLVEIAEETLKVEKEERRAEIYKRMREVVQSGKIDEIQSETEFKAFLRDIDRQELIAEREKETLLQVWREEAEDHNRARAHLTARLEVEEKHELDIARIKSQYEIDDINLDNMIALARKNADFEFEQRRCIYMEQVQIDADKHTIKMELEKSELELSSLRFEQAHAEREKKADFGMRILSQMKQIKRLDMEETLRITREDKIARDRAELENQLKLKDKELENKIEEHAHEIRRIQELAKLSAEALISISPVEQGRVIADLKRTETLKGMNDDQILAMAAERSPHVAQALVERYKAMAQGKLDQEQKDLYTRMLEDKDKAQRLLIEIQTDSIKRVQDTATHAMNTTADIAKAFAAGQSGQPIVVVPGTGGPQVIQGGVAVSPAGQSTTKEKNCPACGRSTPDDSKHCIHCGFTFPGM